MNSRVPGEQTTTGFWVVIAVMAIVLVGSVALFRRRGWL